MNITMIAILYCDNICAHLREKMAVFRGFPAKFAYNLSFFHALSVIDHNLWKNKQIWGC